LAGENRHAYGMQLLERESVLAELDAALSDALRGEGRVALISGEAGIGKTALVGAFGHTHGRRAHVLWGACDALFTPRPLGPMHDIAAQIEGDLPTLLTAASDRGAIFLAALTELQRQPRIVVFEDIHWADESTLDLLRFLGRRIRLTSTLLLLTYRDDELTAAHPLRTLLGDLAASPASLRLALSPLSEEAVRALVGRRPIDPAALHRQTGGNPFFVTEVLSSTSSGLPLTIHDAVLGRVARLSPSAQVVLESAAVLGPRVEPWLLSQIAADDGHAVDECLTGGMLVAQGKVLAFRHELARQIVLEMIPTARRARLHRLALDALRTASAATLDLTRLAHHAEGADDCDALLTYGPAAARQAAAAGAHRAAADLYGAALPCAEQAALAEFAALLEAHATECVHIADTARAIASRRRAVDLWRTTGDRLRQGESLAQLAVTYFVAGLRAEARAASSAAIELLEGLSPGRELALAYCSSGLLFQSSHDLEIAVAQAGQAMAIAAQLGDRALLSRAHAVYGGALMFVDYQSGRQYLERARTIALEAGLDSLVGSAYANIGSTEVELLHLDRAELELGAGLAFTADRDLDRVRLYMLAWLAIVHVCRGRWVEAAAAATEVLDSQATSSNARWSALLALGQVAARRGESTDPPSLQAALETALTAHEIQLIGPVRAARAEAAYLCGRIDAARSEADAEYELAIAKRHVWVTAELAYWRWRCGVDSPPPSWIAEPYALQIAGQWHAAAVAWHTLGCPYEEARALAEGDVAAQTHALLIFDALGAAPAAANLRRAMRARGVSSLPRGPRATTRANQYGLTARQAQILALLAEGLSNPEIAGRLSITPKTAEHHVAAVLSKLAVSSRRAAVDVAMRQRLTGEK
jgi:DNA-binding CsgD family transcriptional regulator